MNVPDRVVTGGDGSTGVGLDGGGVGVGVGGGGAVITARYKFIIDLDYIALLD
ncbi:hypothetical protein QUA69_11135 [Microcoleus sp. LAD1_D1]|uniref:hypothetical protein n=1 Tax=Microcoleus sp. LAD1_D1 TaxID=2818812 RepID=UPI002FD075DB